MSTELSNDTPSNGDQPKQDTTIRLKFEVFAALLSLLVSIIYAYYSLQFRVQDQDRAIISLCSKLNIILASKQSPYQLECTEL